MKSKLIFISLLCVATANNAVAAKPAPVVDIDSATNSVQHYSVEERLARIERQLDARNRAQIRVQQLLDELQQEVGELRGVTELHSHQLSQILERQRELYQELDRRVSEALKSSEQTTKPTSIATNNTNVTYSNNLTENEAYDRAVNMVLKEKRYDQAIPAFKAFNKQYPNSSYAANAHYWLGQLLFNKGELAQAYKEFSVVVDKYTDSPKRSDAMLKLAVVEQKQGNKAKAQALYKKLIAEYPNSSAAKLAKARSANL